MDELQDCSTTNHILHNEQSRTKSFREQKIRMLTETSILFRLKLHYVRNTISSSFSLDEIPCLFVHIYKGLKIHHIQLVVSDGCYLSMLFLFSGHVIISRRLRPYTRFGEYHASCDPGYQLYFQEIEAICRD